MTITAMRGMRPARCQITGALPGVGGIAADKPTAPGCAAVGAAVGSGDVDAVLGDLARAFRLPKVQRDALKVAVIRRAFAFHHANNPDFRRRCDRERIAPDDLRGAADLLRIPLIPVRAFKAADSRSLLSVPLDAIELEVQSTGTGGIPSVARRDAVTTTRAGLAVLAQYREFFAIAHGVGLFLCPSPAETPESGMVKVFNLFSGLLDDRAYLVRDFAFDPREAVAYLRTWEGRQTRHLFGPPFMLARLLRYLEQEGLRLPLDPGSFAVTLGGWKRFNRERIGRPALAARLQEYLGIEPGNVRDLYGLVESNALAVECEYHRKHLPPWCHATVRSVRDPSAEVPPGRCGVVGLLDALGRSYPGFLLTEDLGRLGAEEDCPCGRSGQAIEIVGRLRGSEPGCCAVTVERYMAEKEASRA
jgi:long-chain-fatty-acid---luciferin-component ligase